jgi:hypothetical protein
MAYFEDGFVAVVRLASNVTLRCGVEYFHETLAKDVGTIPE